MLSFFTTSFAIFVRPATPVRELTGRVRRSRRRVSVRARVLQLLLGLVGVGTGIGMILQAGLGVASWDVLNVALSQRLGVSLGLVAIVVGLLAGAAAVALGARPRLRSLAPLFIVSPILELAVRTISTPSTLLGRFGLLAAGMVVLAVGVGAYIGSENGAGPADMLFLTLADRGLPVWAARILLDGSVVVLGWSLGGPVGIGTVVVTAGIGPMIAVTLRWFDLWQAHQTVAALDLLIDRAWGLELHEELEGYLPVLRSTAPSDASNSAAPPRGGSNPSEDRPPRTSRTPRRARTGRTSVPVWRGSRRSGRSRQGRGRRGVSGRMSTVGPARGGRGR